MAKKDKYIVMGFAQEPSPDKEPGLAVRETTMVCDTFAKAYELALFLGGITEANRAYRACLEKIKVSYKVDLGNKASMTDVKASIFKVKSY
jgi:hypothetical protein